VVPAESSLDERNATFWDHLCGSWLARSVGVTGYGPDDLRRFDTAYFAFYPYLGQYLPAGNATGSRVLEVGLGYGTLAQAFVDRGCDFVGVDLADAPVDLAKLRIDQSGRTGCAAVRASALTLPFADESFDLVYSIGCLHHTGGLAHGIDEIRRVLRPGGRAVLMVYNGRSGPRLARLPLRVVTRLARGRGASEEAERARYDADRTGAAAPHTDFVSIATLRGLLHGFSAVEIERRNIGSWSRKIRQMLLALRIDRLIGVDLYVRATR
jgi:SAM-dependent methyltransferase